MVDTDYKYHILGTPSDKYYKSPLLLQVDSMLTNLFSVLEVTKQDTLRRWSGLGLNSLRQIRVCCFMFGLVVMCLIMMFYVLTGANPGLILTPPPYQFGGSVSPGPLAGNLNLSLNSFEQLELLKAIRAKVEFIRRQRIPKREELVSSDPHLFSAIPRTFLKGLRSPCWYEEYFGNSTSDPYLKNRYGRTNQRFQLLRTSFQEHLMQHKGRAFRLRCLPYFYIIGQPKCGTTDLYSRLRLHPEVKFSIFKEPHWWTRRRFGSLYVDRPASNSVPVEDYLDLFDQATQEIQGTSGSTPVEPNAIVGEGSASTMWDNKAWSVVYENSTLGEPPFLNLDFIHALYPDTRFLVILRDPVERLYSDYLFFGSSNKSTEDFHDKVCESLQLFHSCLTESTMRSCVYNLTVIDAMPVRLHVGMYAVFLMDWFSVFSPAQFLVLRLEDHATNTKFTMSQIFRFLHLGPVSEELELNITRKPAANTRRASARELGPMLPVTKDLLRCFYRPFNQELAKVLRNDSFLWEPRS